MPLCAARATVARHPHLKEAALKRFLTGAASLALLVLIVSPFASDARKKRTLRLAVATYEGPEIQVPPVSVNAGDYVVKCPRGWQVTGFGVLNGATDVVYADPTSDGRGYAFAFGNSSQTTAFRASGNVRCQKGGRGLKVRRATTSGGSHRAAVRDWRAAH
jgi:hypothetical protein